MQNFKIILESKDPIFQGEFEFDFVKDKGYQVFKSRMGTLFKMREQLKRLKTIDKKEIKEEKNENMPKL